MSRLYVDPNGIKNAANDFGSYARKLSSCNSKVERVMSNIRCTQLRSVATNSLSRVSQNLESTYSEVNSLKSNLNDIAELYKQMAQNVSCEKCVARAHGQAPATRYSVSGNGSGSSEKKSWIEKAKEDLKNAAVKKFTETKKTIASWVNDWNDPNSKLYKTRKTLGALYTVGKGFVGMAISVAGILETGGIGTPLAIPAMYGSAKDMYNGVTDLMKIFTNDNTDLGGDHAEDLLATGIATGAGYVGLDKQRVENNMRLLDDTVDIVNDFTGIDDGMEGLFSGEFIKTAGGIIDIADNSSSIGADLVEDIGNIYNDMKITISNSKSAVYK